MSKIWLHWYWIVSSFVKKYYWALLIGLLIGSFAFIEGPVLYRNFPVQKVSYIGRVGIYTIQELPLDIQQKVSLGLTKINPDGSTSIDAAQSLSLSEDGKTYSFTLNPEIFWSTGQPLLSSEVNISLNDVETVRPSANSITYSLAEPFAAFPIITSQPILKKTIGKWPWRKNTIIGLKNYQIKDLQTIDQRLRSLTLEGNHETLKYRFYATEEDAVVAYKLGLVDRLENLSNIYLNNWPNSTIQESNVSKRYLAIFFNTKNPDLQEKTIRQMLSYLTPKNAMKNRIISPISKNSWAYNPQVKPYDYNLETARSMYEKIKASNTNNPLNLEITTIPTYSSLAESIANNWKQIGINTTLRVVPYPDTNDYQILLIGQEIPDDPDQYALWHSTQNSNITHYQNPKIDKLLEDGRRETNQDKRKQIYQDFQRFLVEDSPAVFLYELPIYTIYRGSNTQALEK
jgi:peptide/nickel transport system substrate-binding protein